MENKTKSVNRQITDESYKWPGRMRRRSGSPESKGNKKALSSALIRLMGTYKYGCAF
jgi:hypothetical protein